MERLVNVLIPTDNRPAALALTFAGLISQTSRPFNNILSDPTHQELPTPLPERPVDAPKVLKIEPE